MSSWIRILVLPASVFAFWVCFFDVALFLGSNTTYDRLLGSKKRFSQPIPLGEIVNFLVDIWEQEGLYD